MARRQLPVQRAVDLSIEALVRLHKILNKLDKSNAIDRMLEMLTKAEQSIDAVGRLMTVLDNLEIISSAFGGRVDGVRDQKKTKKKKRK